MSIQRFVIREGDKLWIRPKGSTGYGWPAEVIKLRQDLTFSTLHPSDQREFELVEGWEVLGRVKDTRDALQSLIDSPARKLKPLVAKRIKAGRYYWGRVKLKPGYYAAHSLSIWFVSKCRCGCRERYACVRKHSKLKNELWKMELFAEVEYDGNV